MSFFLLLFSLSFPSFLSFLLSFPVDVDKDVKDGNAEKNSLIYILTGHLIAVLAYESSSCSGRGVPLTGGRCYDMTNYASSRVIC